MTTTSVSQYHLTGCADVCECALADATLPTPMAAAGPFAETPKVFCSLFMTFVPQSVRLGGLLVFQTPIVRAAAARLGGEAAGRYDRRAPNCQRFSAG
jgi:hypothetical protein